jgi:WD40 repeat protein
MTDLSGKTLKGYEIREHIGEGGFGAVYRAYETAVNREVAIKVILPQHANHPEFIRGFETEAQTVARLEHPHIVPLYTYWRDTDGAYLVMRYLREGSLCKLLEQGALELETIARILDHITSALAFAHRNSVVHRDLKPDNILVDASDNAYLTDFGIAVAVGRGATDDSITGSLQYMSPEQLSNEPATPSVDIYSLGIVLYEMLTGEYPFGKTSSITELIHKHLNDPVPDNLPGGINDIVQKATDKQPDNRYADAREIAAAFRQMLSGEAIEVETLVLEEVMITNPYKGLRAFQQADAPDFYGRHVLTQRLLERLSETGEASRFLAVVGPSGSGKSSVARAGMIPALQQGDLDGSEKWFIADMIPGPRPLDELEVALTRIAAKPGVEIMAQLERDDHGLHRVAGMLLPDDGELLLMIDQFEEVFTVVADDERRKHFLALLGEAVSHPRSRVRVVITLRADFYDRPLMYPAFGELVRTRMETVMPLTPEDLEQAICRPTEQVGMKVESGLVAAMVAEVSEQPGSLPLLQYSLTELFDRREDSTLTLATYNQIGGVLGALTRRANEIYAGLNDPEREALRQLFLRLVTLGEGTEDLRRRVLVSELTAMGMDSHMMDELINEFANYRLLTMDHDPVTREATVEVAHEALIREWRKIREWLDESRDDIRLQRMLATAARDWRDANQDESYLLSGARLTQFEAWARATDVALTADERQFLDISIAEEQRRQARQRLIRNIAIAITAVVVIVFAVLTLFAFDERGKAQDSAEQAETQAAIATVAQGQAQIEADNAETQAAVAQIERDNAQEARSTSDANVIMANRQAQESHSVALVAGAREAFGNNDLVLALALALEAYHTDDLLPQAQRTLFDLAFAPGPRHHFVEHDSKIWSVAFNPDGQTALSATIDKNLIQWDLETGEILRYFEGHNGPVKAVDISPDGQTALSGSCGEYGSDFSCIQGELILWDMATGTEIRRLDAHPALVNDVAFSPDGETALSGSCGGRDSYGLCNLGELILWDIATGQPLRVFHDHVDTIQSVAYSPDGETALSGSCRNRKIDFPCIQGEVTLWDLATGEPLLSLEGHTTAVQSVTFRPDGRTAVSAGCSGFGTRLTGYLEGCQGEIILWDVKSGERWQTLLGHGDLVRSVAFSPDGHTLISGDQDGVIILWDVENRGENYRFIEHEDAINSLAFSSDGQMLLSGSTDRTLFLWDIHETTGEINRFEGHPLDWVWNIAVNPNGQTVISQACTERRDSDGSCVRTELILWDAETGETIRRLEGHSGLIGAPAFSPDGQTALATDCFEGGIDGPCVQSKVILWDIATGEVIRRFEGHTDMLYSVVVSPDGRTALSASNDFALVLWDMATGEVIRRFEGNTFFIASFAFSPDGQTALSGSYDNTMILWDVTTSEEIRRFDHTGAVFDVAFSPDSRTTLSNSGNLMILWDVTTGEEIRRFGEYGLNSTNRVAFSPDGQTAISGGCRDSDRKTCLTNPNGALVLWDVTTGEEIHHVEGYRGWLQDVAFSPDGHTAVASIWDGTVRMWVISSEALLEWVEENRYRRDFTCAERERYRVEPLCAEDGE